MVQSHCARTKSSVRFMQSWNYSVLCELYIDFVFEFKLNDSYSILGMRDAAEQYDKDNKCGVFFLDSFV